MKPLLTVTVALMLHWTSVSMGAAQTQVEPDTIQRPISAAWMYMSDDQQYDSIPAAWDSINFADVDVLYVGPAGVQADGTFGLYRSPTTGDLANRFRWIIQTARAANPKIKIIVSQWWGNGNGIWGNALSSLTTDAAILEYTASVAVFLQSYVGVSGGVDGYDIDYESNNVGTNTPRIISQIRTNLNVLSSLHGRRFYLTVSPADTAYLRSAVPSLDFVNMQTYEGGINLTPQDFMALGLAPQRLLYGICPETNCDSPTVAQAMDAYSSNGLAGIHLWRLNSDNHVYEGQVQAQIYGLLHPQ